MKKLTLKAYQVQELNAKQMQEQGGVIDPCTVIISSIAVTVAVRGCRHVSPPIQSDSGQYHTAPPTPFMPVAIDDGIIPAAILRQRYRAVDA